MQDESSIHNLICGAFFEFSWNFRKGHRFFSVEKRGRKLYGRIDLLLTEDLTLEEQEALEEKTRRITTQDMALRLDRWSVLTDKGILYINFGTGREKVFDMDDDIVDDDESNCSEGCFCPECEARLKKYGNISAEDVWHCASNSRKIYEYAQRREKKGLIHIENLAEEN
ncbi:MAG: hypothetical protein IKU68_04890 [Oscillospiraceae bacterium]|nr:hypothetical protein [Oscillospiraceae bacterium]